MPENFQERKQEVLNDIQRLKDNAINDILRIVNVFSAEFGLKQERMQKIVQEETEQDRLNKEAAQTPPATQ